jgi:hypothetical protein
MVYLNEVATNPNEDRELMSHLENPGQAIVDFLNEEMHEND